MGVAMHDGSALFAQVQSAHCGQMPRRRQRTPREIVGLDGDPFLDAQDFCDAYTAGSARREGQHILVEVHGSCSGPSETPPDVVAELAPGASGWVFENFRYPRRGSDLMKDLEELRRAPETTH
jgi:hypothetical protein